MVTLRTLAVLSTHDEHRDAALAEYAAESGPARPLRRLRDCVLDATRLWPTTPVILRDSLVPTAWSDDRGSHTIPAGTGFAVVAAAFHRDDGLPFAHTFTPEIWSDGRADTHPALVPFSAGPARCPGENLVLLVTSSMLGALLSRGGFDVTSRVRPTPHAPMPATLDHFGLTFAVR
ncbi:cytochrome P450 [Rhodococcus sp. HNM0569]|uniref:cytochrome P450 n=1 Tax=Rhodococcus sp. HNM0569 TaxID=2716340 RepID=UPI001F0ECDD0|nr:cytochrome P450 [Rhodococcus sp. HNM0569]